VALGSAETGGTYDAASAKGGGDPRYLAPQPLDTTAAVQGTYATVDDDDAGAGDYEPINQGNRASARAGVAQGERVLVHRWMERNARSRTARS